MRIQYASDLHLEFGANSAYLRKNPLIQIGEILVLAGDIAHIGDESNIKHPFWDWASNNFNRVIVVPGNHELYKSFDINNLHNGWRLKVRDNVEYIYNEIIHIDEDTDLIATTLWSKINPKDAYFTEKSVNDFYRIRNGKYRLSWERFNEEHDKCLHFLEENIIASKAKKIIVATHHVPSFKLMSDEFAGSTINGAFTVELENLISNSRINYWIYGHSHRNIDAEIGTTICVSNQLGYVSHGEHLSFKPDACIEI